MFIKAVVDFEAKREISKAALKLAGWDDEDRGVT